MLIVKYFCLATNLKHEHGTTRRACPLCRAERQRRYRASPKGRAYQKVKNYLFAFTNAYEAKKQVYLAVRNKRLPNAKTLRCVDCNLWAQVYDHRDYLKPLDVVPVCRSCNYKRGRGANYESE